MRQGRANRHTVCGCRMVSASRRGEGGDLAVVTTSSEPPFELS